LWVGVIQSILREDDLCQYFFPQLKPLAMDIFAPLELEEIRGICGIHLIPTKKRAGRRDSDKKNRHPESSVWRFFIIEANF
jgi:hypothetical protein